MITLVLGGARSGKSEVAERLAAALPPPVTFLATYVDGGADPDMARRIARHRARRPGGWVTVEVEADVAAAVAATAGTVLVDSLGTWVAARPAFDADPSTLCSALTSRVGDAVVVSDEVGLGVHPSTAAGVKFRDALGAVNAAVAAVADRVVLVVAGRTLALD